jgi:hypothetical protein
MAGFPMETILRLYLPPLDSGQGRFRPFDRSPGSRLRVQGDRLSGSAISEMASVSSSLANQRGDHFSDLKKGQSPSFAWFAVLLYSSRLSEERKEKKELELIRIWAHP